MQINSKRYKKKVTEIEAIQFLGEKNYIDVLSFINNSGNILASAEGTAKISLNTPVKEYKIEIGDYVIRDSSNSFFVCKPYIFENLYEEIIEDQDINLNFNL